MVFACSDMWMCRMRYYVNIYLCYSTISTLAEALMALEQPEVVTEGELAAVNVCVAIVTPNIECPIAFSFELRFSTEDVEAGKLLRLSVVYHKLHINVGYDIPPPQSPPVTTFLRMRIR